MPEMTENASRPHKPQRKKNKETHNAVERHRKKKINAGINRIGELLPCSQALKQSKNMILDQAYRYITELKQQNDTLLLNGGDKVQAEEIRRLRRQLDELRKESAHYMELLKANGINFLDDPTVHWKGRLGRTRLSKVTPAHLVPEGIIVYSNGNVLCPAGEDPAASSQNAGKRSGDIIANQPACSVAPASRTKFCLQDPPASPAAQLVPVPGLVAVEQHASDPHVISKLPGAVSYIAVPTVCPLSATSLATPQPSISTATHGPAPQVTLPLGPLAVPTLPSALGSTPQSQESALRTLALDSSAGVAPEQGPRSLSTVTLPQSVGDSHALRIGSTGSTQTTWTTLQLGPNSVQPFGHAIVSTASPTQTCNSTAQSLQGALMCPTGSVTSIQPVLAQAQVQSPPPVLGPSQVTVQTSMQVPLPPPVHVPLQSTAQAPLQATPTVLPMLQTMQVLQMRSSIAPPAPQTSSNTKVVILQPTNPPAPQAVIREGLANQSSCQHIVIIQANNQNSLQQNPSVNGAPVAVPLTQQIVTSSCPASTTNVHTVGGKHLVHILPRPLAPPTSSPAPPMQAPQTITMNGQVFALQAVKPPAGSSVKTALQIVQPTTSEDPNTNLTLHTLGALANLNQSISHVSNQSLQLNVTPPSYPLAPIPFPVTTAAVNCSPALATSTTSVTSPVGGPVKVLLRKPGPTLAAKPKSRRPASKKGVPTKKMAPRQRDDSLPHPGMGAGQNLPAIEKQIQSTEPSTSTDMPERCSSTRSTEPALQQSEELNNAQCVASTVGGTSGSGASSSSSASRPIVSTSGSPECIFAVSHMTLTLNGPTVPSESPAQSKSISSTAGSSECSKSVVIFTISGPTVSPVSEPVVSGATLTEFPPAVSCVSSSISRPIDSPVSSTVSKLLVTNDASTDGNHKVPSSSFTVTGLSLLTGTSVSHPLDLQDSLANERPALTASSLATLTRPCSVFTSSPAPNVLPPLTECTKSTPPPQTVISPLEPTMLSLASPQGNTVPTEPSVKTAGRDSDPSGHRLSDEGTDKGVPGGGEELSRKASAPPQHVCEMEQDTLGQPLLSSRQTESPVLAGPGGARGFSVASMLPPCHGVSAPGVSFATFTFTSEQAEILAMAARAIFEQDSPGRRSGSCGMESPTPGLASGLSSGPTSDWDLTKAQQTSHSKERSTGSQPKLPKASEITAARPLSEVSVESLEAPARELLAASYPQSSQAHSQSSHSPSAGSLSVNNLIRPTSSCQPYPCSPSLPQQVSVPSPVVPSMTQPPVLLPPCSASGQLSELTPSKTALMRAAGAERRMKDLPKRTAQDDMMVSGSKRPKPCAANAVTRIDMKAVSSDHVQMMPGHPPASLGSSSAPGNRAHPTDGISPLFPGNSFMNTVLRQTDSHCSSQVLQQEHLQLSRSQHGNTGHHQTGNPYLKQQEQQQLQGQRQHLYQLQHHLIQPDPTQLHSLHQRVLQQDQHIQKKRGMVRGGQQAPIISLTQKQHHVEKNGVQHQQQQQQPQQQPQQQHHQQQQQQQPQQQHHQQQQQQPQQQHHQQQQQQPQQQPQQQHHQQQQQQPQQQHHQQQQQQPQQQHHQQQQQQPQQQHHQQQQQQPQQQHHQQQQQQPQQQHHQQSQHHQQQQQQAQQQHHQQQQPQQQHHQQQPQQQHHQQQQQQPQQQHHQQQPQQQHHQQQQQLPQQQPHHQQQQPQPQASHSMHQHIQQHLQQQQHFGSRHQEKSLLHPQQQPRQDQQVTQSHNVMQRLISSRSLEQQLTPQAGNTVSRSSDMTCAPSRQERHRISSYSAEALIGKSSSSGEQRLGLPLQAPRSAQDQPDMRPYLDVSRGKGTHNPQGRLPPEHPGPGDLQRVSECAPFKALSGGQHTLAGFEAQASKPGPTAHRSVQTQGFRMGSSVAGDRQPRGPYPGQQGVPVGTGVQRDHDSCQQSFMQSLLVPQVEQVGHQRAPQCCPPVSMDYGCVSGTPGGDLQAKAGSPSVPPVQKPPAMRLSDTSKGHINAQIGGNMHSGGVRAGLHPPTSHSSAESSLPAAPPTVARPLNAVSQRSRHLGPDTQSGKLRPTERSRPSTLRPGNPFESEGHLALPTGGGVLLGRQQPGGDARRGSIVRFMADSVQVGSDGLVSDQHLAQNFGFSFIPDNAPGINTNPTFMPPVSQSSTARTPSILPVEPQAPLSSFYPSYSPAAHPSLPSDIQLQYFPNQMFSSPNTEKAPGPPLNNRFGSILSPPRPVGFAQASFPLLTDMPPMPITNSSAITPHLSNFNLTSLFPEIATAMPADGSTMPMSPLLSLSNTSSSDSGKQPNRPAHNISHILGHDGTSAI